jgi:hypothetical protein
LHTPNPYTIIATEIQRHGRFTEAGTKIFCASGVCDWAKENSSRAKRTKGHANHVAHYVKDALIANGLLPEEVVT